MLEDVMLWIDSTNYPQTYKLLSLFLVAQVSFFVFNIPYLILHFYPIQYFNKYKIQQNVKIPPTQIRKLFKTVAFNQFGVMFPATFMFGFLFNLNSFPIPTISTIVWQVLACQFIEDLVFYWSHRVLHTPSFYKRFHKQHHEFTAPIGWAAEYASPVDFLVGNIVPFTSGLIILRSHLVVMWIWLALRVWYTTDVHCGYAFPWGPETFLGFIYAGPRHHDNHHKNFIGNYGSTLRIWDWVFGTENNKEKERSQKQAN